MNYTKAYTALVTGAKTRNIEGYTENHHVIPRCLSGTNCPTNLIRLTAEKSYDYWKINKIGYRKLSKYLELDNRSGTCHSMILKFRKGWNPYKDSEFKRFKENNKVLLGG